MYECRFYEQERKLLLIVEKKETRSLPIGANMYRNVVMSSLIESDNGIFFLNGPEFFFLHFKLSLFKMN